ncbi:MAG: glycoside hydrolase family 13 protein [Acetobacter sp.]|nr:glycoside hydrolase family 13 protein [Bacteroides sp.]MCM1340297.1 glycoside hydrolase family 13 protein [Acetobacter sp.]MCM1432753.1 glycoside hydrolase family 13 protein [Clostridiales bacterium]
MQVFNSRNKSYKSIISALATNEKCKFRLCVPRDCRCSSATLAITKEGEETAYYGMFWAGMCGNDREYWELHFSADTAGLYFYHFELDTPWGKSMIKNIGSGIGDFSYDGSDFQQTVYDENFKTPDFLKGGIIYQIFPDRFYNSKKKKSNVPDQRVMRRWGEDPFWCEEQMNGIWNNDFFGGDIKGIEEKLPYIAELGVSCIYINPIFEAHSNHRYDTADYEKIDSLAGNENDLKSLCKTAKEKYGISVILDGVFSHTGCDSRYFNMYGRYDDVGAYNSKNSPYYSWYKFIDYPDNYHAWWGIKLLPEIIEEDESYREYICGKNGILRKWLRCGISGWRLDVADELPDVFLDDLRKAVKEENSDAIIIGEVWEDATNKFAYGERRKYLLGEELDSVMNYPFADAVLNFVRYGNSSYFADSVMSIVENYPPQVLNVLMNHIGTHDTERAITRLAGADSEGKDRHWQYEHNTLSAYDYLKGVSMLKMASLIQFTLPGVPSIYYGDEIGMQGMKDPFNRACMDWDNINNELLKWYKRLGEIRRGTKALADGELNIFYSENSSIAYTRDNENGSVLVAVNNDDLPVTITVGDEWNNSYSFFDFSCESGKVTLPPKRYTMLSRINS